MRGIGTVLAIIGVIVILFALANHFALKLLTLTHGDIYIGIIGIVLLAIGAFMTMSGRKAVA